MSRYDSRTGTVVPDAAGDAVTMLSSAPAADTGQTSLPVRIISSLAAGGTGGGATDITDRAARLLGHVTVDNTVPVTGAFFQATQPVSLATNTPDVVDRAARLLGHVTVDNASLPVTGTFWQATQPVSVATNTPDVTDRAARLLGVVSGGANVFHVDDNAGSLTVDAPAATPLFARLSDGTAALAGQKTMALSLPVTLASDQPALSTADTRLPVALKTLPTGADGLAALPVYITSVLLLSYDVGARNLSSGALTANTAKQMLSIEHGATATKTVKLRRIMVGGIQTAAVAGMIDIQITKGTAASTAGTVVTANQRKGGDAASEAVVKSLPTIVAGTLGDTIPWGATGATASSPMPTTLIYDWQEGGETKPYQLRAGVLESIVINVISTAAQAVTMTVSIDYTEE